MEKPTVTCNNCGWVHFPVSKDYVQKQTQEFGDFWDAASKETKANYWNEKYRGPMPDLYPRAEHAAGYKKCFKCGESYKNFRESKEGDCPDGCTIGPILDKFDINSYD